ncbi:MAG TPA: nucleotidyltransferase family protein [Polyangia bacterium]|nr:nucleotidyltransferase family protein [Polyangia bacterium]
MEPTVGLVQSLVIKAQRQLLDGIGRAVGTKVVYLKAAWADPVLYGGTGQRAGSDLDVLVRPAAFFAFARALEGEGFRRYVQPWLRATFRLGYKAWTFEGQPRWMTVDLHRAIAEAPWFELDPDACVDRATVYDSVDGPILSLCPEDQVLYAAAHYGQHRFTIDHRHLDDVERLLAGRAVAWPVVLERARPAGLSVPLRLLMESLRARGAGVPSAPEAALLRWRLGYAHRWVATAPALERRLPPSRIVDNVLRMPLLSGRPAALPRFVASYLSLRALDVVAEVYHRALDADAALRPGPPDRAARDGERDPSQ